jgi:hypothetical protein
MTSRARKITRARRNVYLYKRTVIRANISLPTHPTSRPPSTFLPSLRRGTCASASGEPRARMVPDAGVESVDRDQAGGGLAVPARIA